MSSGALWKERGLLSSQGSNIKHQKEILQLLQAVQKARSSSNHAL